MSLTASALESIGKATRNEFLSNLSSEQKAALLYDWRFWARDNQLPPEDDSWDIWLLLAGRGFGKTRTGAEFVRHCVMNLGYSRVALVARTAADARDTVVEGEAGLLSVFPPWDRPQYEPSKRRVTFSNGAIATTYSGDKPEQLRGPAHDLAWADELAAWRYPESWDMLQMGLRIGARPISVVTTTPRPVKLINEIVKDPHSVVTTGTTYENIRNLPRKMVDRLLLRYEGTRLGDQELLAKIINDVRGALWSREIIERGRVKAPGNLRHIVIGVDPAATSGKSSDETGIIVAGIDYNGHGMVLEDLSLRGTPSEWATRVIEAYHNYSADKIIAESNNGGEMVSHTIWSIDRYAPIELVHASRGKRTRAEPISALYEQGRISHVGVFAELEDEMCTWVPGANSPDRMDALVWALTKLFEECDEIEVFANPFAGYRG